MPDRKSEIADPSQHLQTAILRWEDERSSEDVLPDENPTGDMEQCAVPQFIDVDVVQLRMRVIALENIVIALLAGGLNGTANLSEKWPLTSLQGPGLPTIH